MAMDLRTTLVWVLMLLCGAQAECPVGTAVIQNIAQAFGVGSAMDEHYPNSLTCTWVVPSDEDRTALTLVLNFFQTEYHNDFLTVYSCEAGSASECEQVWRESGELVAPFAERFEDLRGKDLRVVFTSDFTTHIDSATLNLGFRAHFLDSTGGQCVRACGGAGVGQCGADGYCVCADGFGGADCSLVVPLAVPGQRFDIRGLRVGGWSYFRVDVPAGGKTALFELVDVGSPSSDAYLVIGKKGTLPTLSPDTFAATDWYDWYYDNTDVHFIRANVEAGTWYVGVTNNAQRATEELDAYLKVTLAEHGQRPCLLDCNGHGTCNYHTGHCACDADWRGSYWNRPSSCRFEVKPIAPGTHQSSSLRVGSWDYYRFSVSEQQEYRRTLIVTLQSSSPHARPILMVARGDVPYLQEGLLPGFDAFRKLYGDESDYNNLDGQFQSILVRKENLTKGEYFIGVYNIWGHTGAEESHDTAEYSLYFNLDSAGVPCPRNHFDESNEGEYCSSLTEDRCDFNTGNCSCPIDRVLADCSVVATELHPGRSVSAEIQVEERAYYYVQVDAAAVAAGHNLVITLTKTSRDADTKAKAVPQLLARNGTIPFPQSFEFYDEHDLVSHFHNDDTHELLLDREELGVGTWYVAVINTESSSGPLAYSITARLADSVECPGLPNIDGTACSGAGACDRSLGRCTCRAGHTLDDCSADGVFALAPGVPSWTAAAALSPPRARAPRRLGVL